MEKRNDKKNGYQSPQNQFSKTFQNTPQLSGNNSTKNLMNMILKTSLQNSILGEETFLKSIDMHQDQDQGNERNYDQILIHNKTNSQNFSYSQHQSSTKRAPKLCQFDRSVYQKFDIQTDSIMNEEDYYKENPFKRQKSLKEIFDNQKPLILTDETQQKVRTIELCEKFMTERIQQEPGTLRYVQRQLNTQRRKLAKLENENYSKNNNKAINFAENLRLQRQNVMKLDYIQNLVTQQDNKFYEWILSNPQKRDVKDEFAISKQMKDVEKSQKKAIEFYKTKQKMEQDADHLVQNFHELKQKESNIKKSIHKAQQQSKNLIEKVNFKLESWTDKPKQIKHQKEVIQPLSLQEIQEQKKQRNLEKLQQVKMTQAINIANKKKKIFQQIERKSMEFKEITRIQLQIKNQKSIFNNFSKIEKQINVACKSAQFLQSYWQNHQIVDQQQDQRQLFHSKSDIALKKVPNCFTFQKNEEIYHTTNGIYEHTFKAYKKQAFI